MKPFGKSSTTIERRYRCVVHASMVALLFAAIGVASPVRGADRTFLYLPVGDSDHAVVDRPASAAPAGPPIPDAALPHQAVPTDRGWRAMMDLWRAHHADPNNADIRRFLGLPLGGEVGFQAKRSRAAPSWLGWKPGEYAEVDTPHFVIFSHADRAASEAVAKDIERCYWAWTQFFFPLWEAAPQVTAVLADRPDEVTIAERLREKRSRLSLRRKLRIVLFRDAEQYARTLSREIPGIERSTGFYSDTRKTMCLYASEVDDAATRRHELVHQLFREATRSRLGRAMPGEASEFWLVEGIAGYFESLSIDGDHATVGGWDSPRLQFARYRTLVGGDTMSIDELHSDGRLAAQQREDLARWYAHAIAHTHRLIDGGDANERVWMYRRLAELYKIDNNLPDAANPGDTAQAMTSFLSVDDDDLIANPTDRLLESLCLATCEVTSVGLQSIGPQPQLTWLDLSRLPIDNDAVKLLVVAPENMRQLTLEATQVTAAIAPLITRMTNLQELDLSWTPVDNAVIDAISSAPTMTVLWMTGTKIGDRAVSKIITMDKLQSVDVQRTEVTSTGLETLKRNTPASVNPLQLRPSS